MDDGRFASGLGSGDGVMGTYLLAELRYRPGRAGGEFVGGCFGGGVVYWPDRGR